MSQQTLASDDFKKCLEFHGHLCPGLAIGYKATKAGLEWLKENRAEDEELVAIVETDACGVDATQVLSGCTFGKGNFIFRDHGKNVFSFISRNSGKGVRVALRAGAFQPDDRHMELIQKIRAESATDEERAEFHSIHEKRSLEILDKAIEELFTVDPVVMELPAKARIEPSRVCSRCGEPTMSSKMLEQGEERVCRSCLEIFPAVEGG